MYSRRRKKSQRYYLPLLALLLLAFIALAVAISRQPLNQFDLQVAASVQQLESPGLTKVAELFTTIGSTKLAIIIAVVTMIFLFVVLRHRMELLFLIGSLGGAAVLNKVLKLIIHRERPTAHRLIEETGFSFPSGHTMAAFALYGAIVFLLWRHVRTFAGRCLLLIAGCFMIAMIGLSRIYLGVHHPSDIIGAMLASGLWLGLMSWIFQRYMEKRHVNSSSF